MAGTVRLELVERRIACVEARRAEDDGHRTVATRAPYGLVEHLEYFFAVAEDDHLVGRCTRARARAGGRADAFNLGKACIDLPACTERVRAG